jgi:hypothetical protein
VTTYDIRAGRPCDPVIVIIDDVHWADTASLHALVFASGWVASTPMTSPRWLTALAELPRAAAA